ncbi:acetyltransferase [Polymorphobacter multimanifer]|uniref:acetyltransferase n=1 Tax=Polymorphobacter multimanifer TaxID=1070431 RepID=UPI001669C7D2|nr:acetyltransferase [Polymorphobacter multimanifer]GGI75362.1 acetyltransferase [Polymorphobacter multimanifer]
MTDIFVFGAGGHAKVVIEAIRAAMPHAAIGVLDDDPGNRGRRLLGVEVVGGRDHAVAHPRVPIVPAIGANGARWAVMEWTAEQALTLATVIHPGAIGSRSASIGPGCVLAPGAIVNAEARLGRGTIVKTGASVDHDCIVGEAVHVGPGARICGAVRIGDRSLIGVGAVVVPGIAIGGSCIVGAGAVVIRPVAEGTCVVGKPASLSTGLESCTIR